MKITAGLGSIDEYIQIRRSWRRRIFLRLRPLFLGKKIWHSDAVKQAGGILLQCPAWFLQ